MNRRSLEILQTLAAQADGDDPDGDADLICEGSVCYFGLDRVRQSTVQELLDCVAISVTSEPQDPVERYSINGTGKEIAKRPELADEVRMAVFAGKPFTVKEGRVVLLEDAAHA